MIGFGLATSFVLICVVLGWLHVRISKLEKRMDCLAHALDRFSEAHPELFPHPEYKPNDPRYWEKRKAFEEKAAGIDTDEE